MIETTISEPHGPTMLVTADYRAAAHIGSLLLMQFGHSLVLLTFIIKISSGSFVAVSAYEDRLALFSISSSAGSNIIDKVNLPFLSVIYISEEVLFWAECLRSMF